jgi:hypothetical protein
MQAVGPKSLQVVGVRISDRQGSLNLKKSGSGERFENEWQQEPREQNNPQGDKRTNLIEAFWKHDVVGD